MGKIIDSDDLLTAIKFLGGSFGEEDSPNISGQ